jgi:hypothetical protein
MTQPPGPLRSPAPTLATSAFDQAYFVPETHVHVRCWHIPRVATCVSRQDRTYTCVSYQTMTTSETLPVEALPVPDDGKISISAPSGITGPGVVHLRRISS